MPDSLIQTDYRGCWDARYHDNRQGAGIGTYGEEGSWVANKIRELCNDANVKTLLDLGCGACQLWQKNLPVDPGGYCGVDVSEEALGYAKEAHPNARFEKFELGDFVRSTVISDYDAVISTDVLFHLHPDEYRDVVGFAFRCARRLVAFKSIRGPEANSPDSLHWDHPMPVVPPLTRQGRPWMESVYPVPQNEIAYVYAWRRCK